MENNNRRLIIGSRGSKLALWQAKHVSKLLGGAEIKVIKTSGDVFLDRSLQGQDTKGFFTKEIEQALLAGEIDLAVHSLKDLPTELPQGLTLGAISTRETASDWLLVRPECVDDRAFFPVVSSSRIGATSLRRQSILRRAASTQLPTMLRGNVPTRIEKLRAGEYEAIIIAAAGLKRLEMIPTDLAVFELNPSIWLPAPGQAALGIEIRENDRKVSKAISTLHDDASAEFVQAERELLARFEGGCHAAFGSWARKSEDGYLVSAGYESDIGRWMSATACSDDLASAVNEVENTLRRALSGEGKEEAWPDRLCHKLER